jgi:hypothetical protein
MQEIVAVAGGTVEQVLGDECHVAPFGGGFDFLGVGGRLREQAKADDGRSKWT